MTVFRFFHILLIALNSRHPNPCSSHHNPCLSIRAISVHPWLLFWFFKLIAALLRYELCGPILCFIRVVLIRVIRVIRGLFDILNISYQVRKKPIKVM